MAHMKYLGFLLYLSKPGVGERQGVQAVEYVTMLIPVPMDDSQPARQADMYDKPLSPHTGSQIVAGQLQSLLQSAKMLFPTYKSFGILK